MRKKTVGCWGGWNFQTLNSHQCLINPKPMDKSLLEGALDIELPIRHTATPLGAG